MTVRVDSNSYLTDDQQRVYQLRDALERNGGTPVGFLELLAAVVIDGTWQKVPSGVNQEEPFSTFADFIEAKPPFGLGANVENVRILLQLRHPHEGVPRIRKQMNKMRAEVHRLLGPDPKSDPITRDAQSFGAHAKAGGWVFGLMVARSVQPNKGNSGDRKSPQRYERSADTRAEKVSATRFAEISGTSHPRVMRYYHAWGRAADAGVVPSAGKLAPGQEIDLPPAETWGTYFSPQISSDNQENLAAEAEASGTTLKKTVAITENRPALRAAILADPETAEAAHEALMERPEIRVRVMAKVMANPVIRKEAAVETRRAERVDFVRQVAEEGKAKTPAGQVIDLPPEAHGKVAERLVAIEGPQATHEAVTEAYEAVRTLITDTVESDVDLLQQEHRTRYMKALKTTVKSLEAIDPDHLATVIDDDVRESVKHLQEAINALVQGVADPENEAEVIRLKRRA